MWRWNGHMSLNLFAGLYDLADMIEPCAKGIALAKAAMKENEVFGYAEMVSIKDFQ